MKSDPTAYLMGNFGVLDARSTAARPDRPVAEAVTVPAHQVLRLDKSTRIKKIELKHGLIWLTGSPAQGDVILAPGESYELPDTWPFVLQALEPAEVWLQRTV